MIIVVSPFSPNPLAIPTGHDGVWRIVSIVSGDVEEVLAIKTICGRIQETDQQRIREVQVVSRIKAHIIENRKHVERKASCSANVSISIALWHSKHGDTFFL